MSEHRERLQASERERTRLAEEAGGRASAFEVVESDLRRARTEVTALHEERRVLTARVTSYDEEHSRCAHTLSTTCFFIIACSWSWT